jgi:hypothetical protein
MMAKTFLLGQLFQSRAAHLMRDKTMGIACAQPILPFRLIQPVGWVERSDTHHVMDVQRGDGFRK